MSSTRRYSVDEMPQEEHRMPAARRVAHVLLRESLSRKVSELRLVADTGRAEIAGQGRWIPAMEFPPAVYDAVASDLCEVAGLTGDIDGPSAAVELKWGLGTVTVAATCRSTESGRRDLTFRFAW